MPILTKTFTTASGRDLTLRRPDFRSFRNIASKVSALLAVEMDAAMTVPEFEQVLQACTVENLDEYLSEADYAEVAELWDAILEYCEFESFFATRRTQRAEADEAYQLEQFRQQARQIEMMKESGLLPKSWSLADAMNAANDPSETLTSMLSSSTTTPTTTGGGGETSNGKTTGLSSATSPSRSRGGKRKSA